jgi:hypothetical protein
MKLEVRVPISPRDFFFRRVEYLNCSLRACGGITGDAHLVVSVGDDIEPFDLLASQPWSRDQVTWRWVDRAAFRRDSYFATVFDRFMVRSDADIVLFADADVIFVSGVDDLLESLMRLPTIAGVIAHAPPKSGVDWNHLFAVAKIPPARDAHQYSGWRLMFEDPHDRFAPAYYNFGAVFVPASWVAMLAHAYRGSIAVAETAGFDFFKAQIALTLALYRLGLRRLALELRYNFPNDPLFDSAHPRELDDVRILHYLRTEILDRDGDFASPEALKALVARRDLIGSNEILRKTVEKLGA